MPTSDGNWRRVVRGIAVVVGISVATVTVGLFTRTPAVDASDQQVPSAGGRQSPKREPNLVATGRPIASARDWYDDTYFWVSQDSILALILKNEDVQAIIIDTKTGREHKPERLNRLLRAQKMVQGRIKHFLFSPSKKQLLWSESTLLGPNEGWSCASLDGSVVAAGSLNAPDDYRPKAFVPDASGWISLSMKSRYLQVILQPLKHSEKPPRIINLGIRQPRDCRMLGFAETGHVILLIYDREAGRTTIVNFMTDSDNPTLKQYFVTLPAGMTLEEVVLSPNHHRLAWLLSSVGYSSTPSRVRRYGLQTSEIWISDERGGEMRLVSKSESMQQGTIARAFQWLPSGKQLSFISNDDRLLVFDLTKGDH